MKSRVNREVQARFCEREGVKLPFPTRLSTTNSTELLKKALDAGEISLLNYMVELGLYYNIVNQTLEAERDYHKALTELSAVEL